MKSIRQFRIPGATYRLQFNSGFSFARARALLPYLEDLGITDLYSSPIFTAPPESNHGYDVCDYNQLNPLLGSAADWKKLTAGVRSRQMGFLMDFVPNHMGASPKYNQLWRDVLKNGVRSRYTDFFDIDWAPPQTFLKNKVLLPILEDDCDKLLGQGLFRLELNGGAFQINYRETPLPLSPQSSPGVLDKILGATRKRSHDARHLTKALGIFNQQVTKPTNQQFLKSLLQQQHYHLAYWRTGTRLANYRRFFDVDSLAAVKMERPENFQIAHHLLGKLVHARQITGLRLDHIDGLADPATYLNRLQHFLSGRVDSVKSNRNGPFYILVEKITMPGESLRAEWPVSGTTGYDFTTLATGCLIDPGQERRMTNIYSTFISDQTPFRKIVDDSKRLVMGRGLAKEMDQLSWLAKKCADLLPRTHSPSLADLKAALTTLIIHFPRYRTYLVPGSQTSREDQKILRDSFKRSEIANPVLKRSLLFLRKLLFSDLKHGSEFRENKTFFCQSFQQFTGPIMAKSYEDTAFFIYNRLIALNEVGGCPGNFGVTPREFHVANELRLRVSPDAMLTTSTHDTKISEDVRARIAAISEWPPEWATFVSEAARCNKAFKTLVDGEFAPDKNDEYRFVQALVGTWPLEKQSGASRKRYTERLQQFIIKSQRESKVHTAWDAQNTAYENATKKFVLQVINHPPTSFSRLFEPLAAKIAQLGAINSLTQTLLKLTVPGIPDFYQGNELWQFLLTDPDNRGQIDYALRRKMLLSVKKQTPSALLKTWETGAIKMLLIRTVLRFRRANPLLFQRGAYVPLDSAGTFDDSCLAFARSTAEKTIVVVAPRLTSQIGFPPIGDCWKSTILDLSRFGKSRFKNLFTGALVTSSRPRLAEILQELPFAILVSS